MCDGAGGGTSAIDELHGEGVGMGKGVQVVVKRDKGV